MQPNDIPNEVSVDLSKPELAVHEWLAVLAISFFLVFLTFLSYIDRSPNFEQASLHYLQPLAEVNIEGAVVFPGVYRVPVGSSMLEAIQTSIPLPSANLSAFRPSSKVRASQSLKVPAQEKIQVEIAGAIANQGVITLPVGARLSDLMRYIILEENADVSLLKKKRRLKPGEKIVIPYQKN